MEKFLPYLTDYYLLPYVLIFLRVGFVFAMLGFFIGNTIPTKIKVVVIFWLTIFYASIYVSPSFFEKINALLVTKTFFELIINEFLVAGLVVAILNLFVYAYKIMGELLTFSGGLSMAQIYDPNTGSQEQIFSRVFWVLTMYLFFHSELYYYLLVGFDTLLETVAFGTVILDEINFLDFYTHKLTNMTLISFLLVFPFFIITSSVDLFFGYITRNTPAFNIFSIAFQLKIFLIFVFLFLSINAFIGQLTNLFLDLKTFQ